MCWHIIFGGAPELTYCTFGGVFSMFSFFSVLFACIIYMFANIGDFPLMSHLSEDGL